MPSKKKKYNARFPPARIKKIMQTDEEIGKVAAAVPVIIYLEYFTQESVQCAKESFKKYFSRALELFLESLLTKACHVTQSRNAKTMTTSHLKQCIELEQQFDFLKDLVSAVPDMQGEGDENHAEGAEKIPRRGRKTGSGRKNGGAGVKGKDKKLSGTESEQEDDSEDSETDGEEEDVPQPNTHMQAASHFHSPDMPPQYMPMGAPQGAVTIPISSFASHPAVMGVVPAPAPPKDENDDDEDYDS